MIIQYGYQSPSDNTIFPISFTTYCSPMAILHDSRENYSCRIVNKTNLTSLEVRRGGSSNGWFWIAIGY